jgi:hypothetical protein
MNLHCHENLRFYVACTLHGAQARSASIGISLLHGAPCYEGI